MYYICVAYVEPNLVSLLAAQFLACFAQHRPGKNSHNRHRNALQYHHTIFVINNFLQFVFLNGSWNIDWTIQPWWCTQQILLFLPSEFSKFSQRVCPSTGKVAMIAIGRFFSWVIFRMSPQIISEEEVFILMTKSWLCKAIFLTF